MAILYEDPYLICDDDAITIHQYYFPLGSKRIAYSSIEQMHQEPMDYFSGSLRFWGMGLAPYWFHLDWERPYKNRCIILDSGEWIKPVITPTDQDVVWRILQAKGVPSSSR
jgi:hypothetical protein